MQRLLTHLFLGPTLLRRHFPPTACDRIAAAIRAAEQRHSAQIRFCVEGAFDFTEIVRGYHPRDRAIELFSELRVWDTTHNNGVLLYLLLADRDIEIVADRGLEGVVAPAEWQSVCAAIEEGCRSGAHTDAVIAGIDTMATILARHFPPSTSSTNELPDEPVVRL